MRVKFPEKIDNTLRFLKYKLLPKTLFFRTMLLIFIPLIVGSGGFDCRLF